MRKPEGKEPFRRPKRRWENNIKISKRHNTERRGTDSYGLEKWQVGSSCES